jgi:preprotein translocase subunit YajC
VTTFPLIALMLQAPRAGSPMFAIAIQILAFAAIFWFLLIRPQRKAAQRHREVLAALQRNDEVVTEGGIIGSVVHLADDRVTIRTGENTRIVVARSKIARVLSGPTAEQTR